MGALGISLKALSDTTFTITDDGGAIAVLSGLVSGCAASLYQQLKLDIKLKAVVSE